MQLNCLMSLSENNKDNKFNINLYVNFCQQSSFLSFCFYKTHFRLYLYNRFFNNESIYFVNVIIREFFLSVCSFYDILLIHFYLIYYLIDLSGLFYLNAINSYYNYYISNDLRNLYRIRIRVIDLQNVN